ncbi:MAG: hypothetical protein EOP45_13345 [Sphingobacteriaceae bacterium]|nr:MAG: hypothetical protein EOP45_13345 [Sphingobacteriaceae bacterium]
MEYLDTIHAIVAENERRLRHMETRARMSCHHKLREILFAFRTVYQSTSNPITYPTYFIDQTLNFVNNIRDDLPRWIHCIQSTSVMPLTTVIQSMPNYTLTSTPNDQDEFKLRIERGIVRGQQDYDISIVMWQFLTAFEFYDIRNRILRLDPMYLRLENYVLFRGTEQIKYLLSEAIDEA